MVSIDSRYGVVSAITGQRTVAGRRVALLISLLLSSIPLGAQTLAALQGRVFDSSGSVLPGATVRVQDASIGFDVSVRADGEGRYYVVALPSGRYTITTEADGFRSERIDALNVDVGRTLVRDFRLAIGEVAETVVVRTEVPLVDRATASLGHVVTAETVRHMPLNGRHFMDLGLLVPGSVAPSQTGFSSRPIRGVGTLAFNTAGNREEAVGFEVNGVTTNNLTFGSLIFEPPLTSIQELKVDNSVLAAEHGHVSGAVVKIVTQSGSDSVRGDAFEFLRNDALDARNFFEFTSDRPNPFSRHQFGGSAGGPIRRGRTFFFASYEGQKQRQGVDLNSLVLSDEQRAAATDPAVRRLIPLIPRANYFDADGTPRFVGSAPAVAEADRWTIDLRHNAGRTGRFQAYYGGQHRQAVEPGTQGNSIPGFGSVFNPFASLLTINAAHMFGAATLNEARFGRVRHVGGTFPAAPLNPADFNIGSGVTRAIGLPQMIVAGALNFGGPGTLPLGRTDTSFVVVDTFSHARGRQSLKLGGEYRHFVNENFAEGTGVFNFPSVEAFLTGTANAFTITLGERRSVIDQRAVALFVQDRITIRDAVTLDLGLRYEWHVTPTERDGRFVVFDTASASLRRVGVDVDEIYRQNNRNLEPRLGVAWNLSRDGRTVFRAAYGRAVDQPGTTAVRDTAGNPPFAVPVAAAGSIPLVSAIETARPGGLAPATIDPLFQNASMRSWNVNVQRQLARDLAATVGYSGSRGANLRLSRNLNQPVDGLRPFPTVASLQSHPSRHPAWQHHPGREQWLFQLSGGVGGGHQAAVPRSADRHLVHLVEVPRYQLTQFVRLRRPERLRHSRSIRLVGFRRAPPVRPQRNLRPAVHEARPDARVAACRGRPVAERQSRQHRDQQQQSERRGEQRAPRCHRTDPDHRVGGPVVRSVGVRGGRSFRQPGAQRRHRTGLQQHGCVTDQERPARYACRPAVQGRHFRCVQPSELRSAGQHRRQPGLRQDYENATAHG